MMLLFCTTDATNTQQKAQNCCFHSIYLVYGQEHFKGYPFIRLQMVRALLDIRLSGVLSKRTQGISDLRHVDLAVTTGVKQLECFLELCRSEGQQVINFNRISLKKLAR